MVLTRGWVKNQSKCLCSSPSQKRKPDNDAFGNTVEMVNAVQESVDCDKLGQEFNKILNDVEKSLWNGYKKFTKLSSLVTLYNIKVKCGLSYMIFKLVFLVLANMFLEDHKLSNSLYEVKKNAQWVRNGIWENICLSKWSHIL